VSAVAWLPKRRRSIVFLFCLDNTFADPFDLRVVKRPVFPSICGDGVCFSCCWIALPSSQGGQDRIAFCVCESDYHLSNCFWLDNPYLVGAALSRICNILISFGRGGEEAFFRQNGQSERRNSARFVQNG
jgi:hypothetical protein